MQPTQRPSRFFPALLLLPLLTVVVAPIVAPPAVQVDAATSRSIDRATPIALETNRRPAGVDLFAAPAGTRFTFTLDGRIEVAVRRSDEPAAEPAARAGGLGVVLQGAVHTTLLGRDASTLWLAQDWRELRVVMPGAGDAAALDQAAQLERSLRQGCEQRLDRQGRLLAMRCRGSWPDEHRRFARALAQLLACEGRAEGTWSSQHEDGSGEHHFEHAAERTDATTVTVVRHRTGFLPRGADAASVACASGVANARFDTAIGWLQELAVADELAWRLFGGSLTVLATGRATLHCVAVDQVPVPEWDGSFADESLPALPARAGDPMQAAWLAKLGDTTVEQLLADLQAEIHAGAVGSPRHAELLQLLAAMLKHQPLTADRLVQLVRSGKATEPFAADLLAALGMAGTNRAQAGLVDVFTDPTVASELRRAGVEATSQLAAPAASVVTAMRDLVRNTPHVDPLVSSALLALGSFAGRGAPESHGPSMLDTLLAAEAAARRDGAGRAWCEALGNSGDQAVLPVAERMLRAGDPAERIGGLTAMRRVVAPTVARLVASVARNDVDAEVRREALQIAAERDEPWASTLLQERAIAEGDPEIRRFAYSGLGWRARRDASCREFLVVRSQQEPVAELRAMLQSLLASPE